MSDSTNEDEVKPFVSDSENLHEFTFRSLAMGVMMGVLFGASSLYLLMKVGMTVSASVPIAVLSITFFRAMSSMFGIRRATILENNIVQTTGSAGESIAFGVGATMPALFLLGFEMDWVRVMTVSVLGGLLGVLMMIPLRRAFIVKQHKTLPYPEGTACAEVLMAGERGGGSAFMVFLGFGIAFFHKFLSLGAGLWSEVPKYLLYAKGADGASRGLKGAAVSGELSPELLGVGYIIGPKTANMMMAGAVLSYFVIGPLIVTFGESLTVPIAPAVLDGKGPDLDKGLIGNMGPDELRVNYLRFIGAGAVAAGGVISMGRALPLIIASIASGLRDLKSTGQGKKTTTKRTEQDLPMSVVLFGSLGLILVLMAVPSLGLGFSFQGFLGALMILVFGFLFVTVSSRLTGEIGSSSNPISGMTIATLLLTCLIFRILGETGALAMLTALTVASVVCIASSNGGTTSQDLKTGYLVGSTPKYQQLAILIGALLSSTVIGITMLALNSAGVHYTKQNLPTQKIVIGPSAPQEKPGRPYDGEDGDANVYSVVNIRSDDKLNPGVEPGRYLIDAEGTAIYRTDLPGNQKLNKMDNGKDAPKPFDAPQPPLFASIIEGILGGRLQWELVIAGALVSIGLELAGVSALPIAVGMYLSFAATAPIFLGGLVRWISDLTAKYLGKKTDGDTSPGVLLSSGYIAGGTLCGLMILMSNLLPLWLADKLKENKLVNFLPESFRAEEAQAPMLISLLVFIGMGIVLYFVSLKGEVKTENKE